MFVNTSTGAPIYDLRRLHPDISFPAAGPDDETLAALGYARVSPVAPPAAGLLQQLVEADPVQIDGAWVQAWSLEYRPLEEAHAILVQAIRAKRLQVERGGVNVGGMVVATDPESVALVNGAYNALKEGFLASTPWRLSDGAWVTLTLPEVTAVAAGVAQHISACYAREKSLMDAVAAVMTGESPQVADLAAIDIQAGWPGA